MKEEYKSKNSRSVSSVIAALLLIIFAAAISYIIYLAGVDDETRWFLAEAGISVVAAVLLLFGRKSQLWSMLCILQLFADWFCVSVIFGDDIYIKVFRLAPTAAFLVWFYMIIDSETKDAVVEIKNVRWMPGILSIMCAVFSLYEVWREVYHSVIYNGVDYHTQGAYLEIGALAALLILQPIAGILINKWLNRILLEEVEEYQSSLNISKILAIEEEYDTGVVFKNPSQNAAIAFLILGVLQIAAAFYVRPVYYVAAAAISLMTGIVLLRWKQLPLCIITMIGNAGVVIADIRYAAVMPFLRPRITRIAEVAAYILLIILMHRLWNAKKKKSMERVRNNAFYPSAIESAYGILILVYSINMVVNTQYSVSSKRVLYMAASTLLSVYAFWMLGFWIREQAEFELQKYRAKLGRRDGEIKTEFAQELDVPEEMIDAISIATGGEGLKKEDDGKNVIDFEKRKKALRGKKDHR